MPFDRDSGLVFSEKVIKKSKKGSITHDCSTRTLGQPPKRCSTGDGIDSLYLVALRKLLCNLDNLDTSSLSTVPEDILKRIWEAIQRSQLGSVRIWRVFAQSEIGQRSILHDRVGTWKHLGQAIPQAIHAECAWVTTLDITTETLNADLVRVSELRNLRRFHMATNHETETDEGFNDRVLRTWADQARNDGAFALLQSIFLFCQVGITTWSLGRLSAFPALDEFCAYRSNIEWRQAKSMSGWHNDAENGFIAFVESSKAYSVVTYSHSKLLSWNNLVSDYFNSRISASKDPIDLRPVLNLQIRRGGSQGLRLNMMGDDMVCLQRCTDTPLSGQQQKEHLPRTSTKPTAPPPVKKRKLMTNSTALEDMML